MVAQKVGIGGGRESPSTGILFFNLAVTIAHPFPFFLSFDYGYPHSREIEN
jgi:hypothetical protein